jgi:hypothetical protein
MGPFRQRTIFRRELVAEGDFLKGQIVRVNVRSRLNRKPRAADRLAIAQNWLARLNGSERDLMTGWNSLSHHDTCTAGPDRLSGSQANPCDGDVI